MVGHSLIFERTFMDFLNSPMLKRIFDLINWTYGLEYFSNLDR